MMGSYIQETVGNLMSSDKMLYQFLTQPSLSDKANVNV